MRWPSLHTRLHPTAAWNRRSRRWAAASYRWWLSERPRSDDLVRKLPTACRAPGLSGAGRSVLVRMRHAVDDEHVLRLRPGLEFQPELFLQRREEVGASVSVGVGRAAGQWVWRPRQADLVRTLKARVVDHGTSLHDREKRAEQR